MGDGMSIATEITRLQSAKSAIKTAIEGKGVTVPSGTLLDGMAALIESIDAGGGVDGFQTVSGRITLSEDTTTLDISMFLGFTPLPSKAWSFSFFTDNDDSPYTRYQVLACFVCYYGPNDSSTNTKKYTYDARYRSRAGSSKEFYKINETISYSEGVITLPDTYNYNFPAGKPFNYIYHGEE